MYALYVQLWSMKFQKSLGGQLWSTEKRVYCLQQYQLSVYVALFSLVRCSTVQGFGGCIDRLQSLGDCSEYMTHRTVVVNEIPRKNNRYCRNGPCGPQRAEANIPNHGMFVHDCIWLLQPIPHMKHGPRQCPCSRFFEFQSTIFLPGI